MSVDAAGGDAAGDGTATKEFAAVELAEWESVAAELFPVIVRIEDVEDKPVEVEDVDDAEDKGPVGAEAVEAEPPAVAGEVFFVAEGEPPVVLSDPPELPVPVGCEVEADEGESVSA